MPLSKSTALAFFSVVVCSKTLSMFKQAYSVYFAGNFKQTLCNSEGEQDKRTEGIFCP